MISQTMNKKAKCAWDAALSEVRVVFAFIAITLTCLGYLALDQGDKSKAQIFIYGGLLTAMLFVISAISDTSEIFGSQNDNENLCSLKGKYSVPEMVKVLYYECSFIRYYVSVLLTVACGAALVGAAYLVEKWARVLPLKAN